jgi:hypothetical protein
MKKKQSGNRVAKKKWRLCPPLLTLSREKDGMQKISFIAIVRLLGWLEEAQLYRGDPCKMPHFNDFCEKLPTKKFLEIASSLHLSTSCRVIEPP